MKMHAIKQLLGIPVKGHTSKAFVLVVAVTMLAILLTFDTDILSVCTVMYNMLHFLHIHCNFPIVEELFGF